MKEIILSEKPLLKMILGDCEEYMKTLPDKSFDLAIVDPPYFEGPQNSKYFKGNNQKAQQKKYKNLSKSWKVPDINYFNLLDKVSKNQIIWGINYFNVCKVGGRIVWIKGDGKSPFSMADIAYQSFYNRIDLFKYIWSGFWREKGDEKEQRIHTTQKPVALYKFCLNKYAKKGQTIFDTHGGSFSSAIACYDLGYDFTGIEIDADQFELAVQRIQNHLKRTPGIFKM